MSADDSRALVSSNTLLNRCHLRTAASAAA